MQELPAQFSKPLEFHGFKIPYYGKFYRIWSSLPSVPKKRFGLNKDFGTEQSKKIQRHPDPSPDNLPFSVDIIRDHMVVLTTSILFK
jgi:hypothetical protein